jgi:hypothetical protein
VETIEHKVLGVLQIFLYVVLKEHDHIARQKPSISYEVFMGEFVKNLVFWIMT